MAAIEEQPTADELLTGAELYHHLVATSETQITAARVKAASYGELITTLSTLLERTRHSILAPVAGGLGYFEAELVHTNDVLVLLGDSWFAERSVAQARGIAERRVAFLERERLVLENERRTLDARRDLFFSEFDSAPTPTAAPSKPSQHKRQPSGTAAVAAPAGEGSDDAAFAAPGDDVFDEADNLTEQELLELERDLGDAAEDDEAVDRALLDRMIAKKQRRVAEERRQRREQQKQATAQAVAPETKAKHVRFNTPADIGLPAATAAAASPVSAKSAVERIAVRDEVVERNPNVPPPAAPLPTVAEAPKRVSLFRQRQ